MGSKKKKLTQLALAFMIPFQLSPVAMRKRVRKAMPKERKCACSPRPWHGCSSSQPKSNSNITELIRAQAPVWVQGMANVVLRGVSPLRWLSQGDNKLGFLIGDSRAMALVKKNLGKIKK